MTTTSWRQAFRLAWRFTYGHKRLILAGDWDRYPARWKSRPRRSGSAQFTISERTMSQPLILAKPGDTAVNDAGFYWYKTGLGWKFLGDLTTGPNNQVFFRDILPPPDDLGIDGDVAIGPNNRVMRKEAGAWVDLALAIPAPTDLVATVTDLHLGRLESGGFHSYDVFVGWTEVTGYLVEIDQGNAPTALDGSDSVWGDLELAAVTGSAHQFRRLVPDLNPTTAFRIRFRGAFEQRGAWTAAYIRFVGQPRLSVLPNPLNVGANETTNLSIWVANATSTTLTEVGGTLSQAVALNAMGNFFGALIVSPGGSGSIYRVVATNAVGDSMEEHLVSVFQRQGGSITPPSGAPRIDTFFADDAGIEPGGSTTLRWMTSGALVVSIDQGVGSVDPDGSIVVSPTSTRIYTLTAGEGTEAVTAAIRISVRSFGFNRTPIIGFYRSSPTVIQSGSSSTLSWHIESGSGGTATLSIDQGVGAVTFDADGMGSVSVSPTATTTYRLTATNSIGSASDDATVTIGTAVDPPVIDTFTADPAAITEGESATLEWMTTNATSVQLAGNPAALALDGSLTVTPTETTIYTLEATNDDSTVTVTVTVTVGDVPTGPRIDSFSVDDSIILTGESTTLRWTTSNTTDVSLISRERCCGRRVAAHKPHVHYCLHAHGGNRRGRSDAQHHGNGDECSIAEHLIFLFVAIVHRSRRKCRSELGRIGGRQPFDQSGRGCGDPGEHGVGIRQPHGDDRLHIDSHERRWQRNEWDTSNSDSGACCFTDHRHI